MKLSTEKNNSRKNIYSTPETTDASFQFKSESMTLSKMLPGQVTSSDQKSLKTIFDLFDKIKSMLSFSDDRYKSVHLQKKDIKVHFEKMETMLKGLKIVNSLHSSRDNIRNILDLDQTIIQKSPFNDLGEKIFATEDSLECQRNYESNDTSKSSGILKCDLIDKSDYNLDNNFMKTPQNNRVEGTTNLENSSIYQYSNENNTENNYKQNESKFDQVLQNFGNDLSSKFNEIKDENYKEVFNQLYGLDISFDSDKDDSKDYSAMIDNLLAEKTDKSMQTDRTMTNFNVINDENFVQNVNMNLLTKENSKLKEDIKSFEANVTHLLDFVAKLKSQINHYKHKQLQIEKVSKSLAKKDMELGILQSYNDKRKNNLNKKLREVEVKQQELRQKEIELESIESVRFNLTVNSENSGKDDLEFNQDFD